MQTVLASELQHLEYLEANFRSLEAAITEVSCQDPWRKPVEALCCFRGIKTLTAMTIVSGIGDIKRIGSRRVLVESAWHDSKRAGSTLRLQRRRMGQDPTIVGIAVKAQHRIERRYHHLARTKHTNKAITAVARELCGFLWSALREVEGR